MNTVGLRSQTKVIKMKENGCTGKSGRMSNFKHDEVFVAEFDFYQDVLGWTFDDEESLSQALVDEAWSLYRDYEEDEKLYRERDDLAGERYLTEIELDGPTVRVTIHDARLPWEE